MSTTRDDGLKQRILVILTLCFVAVSQGCNRQGESCLVTGAVQWEGKPVYPGSIVLTSQSGEPYVGNLTSEGTFFVQTGPPGNYKCAIQVHELSGLSRLPTTPSNSSTDPKSSEPLRREDTVPAQFRSANIDIPPRYRSANTSNLSFDIQSPETDLGVVKLEK